MNINYFTNYTTKLRKLNISYFILYFLTHTNVSYNININFMITHIWMSQTPKYESYSTGVILVINLLGHL